MSSPPELREMQPTDYEQVVTTYQCRLLRYSSLGRQVHQRLGKERATQPADGPSGCSMAGEGTIYELVSDGVLWIVSGFGGSGSYRMRNQELRQESDRPVGGSHQSA